VLAVDRQPLRGLPLDLVRHATVGAENTVCTMLLARGAQQFEVVLRRVLPPDHALRTEGARGSVAPHDRPESDGVSL